MLASLKRYRIRAGAALAAAVLGAGGYLAFREPAAPPALPAVDLEGVDPRIATAVRHAEAGVREAPESGAAWGRLGQVLLANEFYAPAQACLARAEELDPTNPRWPYLQSRLNPSTNPQTEPKLRRAIELCDKQSVAGPILHLADWLLSRGRIDEAEAEFRRSLQVATNNPWGRVGMTKVALARGDAGAALAALEPPGAPPTARETIPRTYHTLRAEIEQRRGNPDAAAAAARLSRSLPKDPDPPDPFSFEVVVLTTGVRGELVRANGYLSGGQVSDAVNLLAQITREYPGNHLTWLALGRAQLAAGDLAAAEQAVRAAVRIAPDATPAHTLLGRILAQAGRPTEAAAAFRRATECQPGNPAGHLALADALDKAGDPDGAAAALRDGLRHAPQDAALHLALGARLVRAKRMSEAVPYLRDAARLAPDDPKIRALLEEAEGQNPGPK